MIKDVIKILDIVLSMIITHKMIIDEEIMILNLWSLGDSMAVIMWDAMQIKVGLNHMPLRLWDQVQDPQQVQILGLLNDELVLDAMKGGDILSNCPYKHNRG